VRELALHLLDIAENSVAAGAKNVTVTVEEDTRADRLVLRVEDDGCGMDAQTAAAVLDPFVTSRTTRKVGLGLPLLKAAAEACNGGLKLTSAVGQGTRLECEFQRSHIDRMPLGDVAGTMLTLVISAPHIHWVYRQRADAEEFVFDDQPIKAELGDVPLTEPDILGFIRATLQDGVAQVQAALAETKLFIP
jgi:Histidine kinase-, DNA gyrase B-, and HSP90-like ATPase